MSFGFVNSSCGGSSSVFLDAMIAVIVIICMDADRGWITIMAKFEEGRKLSLIEFVGDHQSILPGDAGVGKLGFLCHQPFRCSTSPTISGVGKQGRWLARHSN